MAERESINFAREFAKQLAEEKDEQLDALDAADEQLDALDAVDDQQILADSVIDLVYPKISSDLFEQNLQRNPEEEGYKRGTTPFKLLAVDTAFALKKRNPNFFEKNEDPYKALALGTARFLPEEDRNKQITDQEIIRRYLRNPDNKPMREGSFARGFAKQIAPSAGGLAGFVGGVKTGYALQTAIPPAPNPFVIGAKFLVPVATGIAGQFAGEEGVEAIKSYFFGAPDLVDPKKGGDMERVGETAAVALSFAPIPYMTTKEAISFGAKKSIDAITKAKIDKLQETLSVGPVLPSVSRPVLKEAARKPPLSTRLIAKAEEAVPKIGRRAAEKPIFTGIEEASFAAGATGGKYIAEEYFEGKGAFPLEMGVGLGAGLTLPAVLGTPYLIVKNWGAVTGGLKKLGKALNPRDQEVPLSALFSRQGQEQSYVDVANIIEERLREAGEDPEKIAEAIEEIANDPKFRDFTSGTISQSPTLLRIEQEMAGLFPDLKAQGQKGVRSAIDNYKQLIAAYAMVGDAAALREIELAFQDTIERAFIDQLDLGAQKVLDAARKVGTGETDTAVGIALQKRLSEALTAARTKERFLYANLPQVEINVFRAFPEEGEEVGEVVRLPNLFNFIDRLPVSRTGLKYLPAPIKQQVSYIIEILDNAGIDTSRLGKRGSDAGDSSVSNARNRVENTLDTLGRRRQAILDKMSDYTKNGMRNLLDLVSSSPRFGGMSPDEQILAVQRDLNAIETLMNAARGRRNVPEDELRYAELGQVKDLLQNRLTTARAQQELTDLGRASAQRTPEQVEADEILDLRVLVEELRGSEQPISISSRFLTEMRSKALSANRELTAAGQYDEAGMAKMMADLVDQDLTGAIDDIAGADAKASITAARAFSQALNDVFTRATAPSILLGTKSTGAAAVSPEEAVRTLFTGRSDRVLRNAREISQVGQFLRDRVNPDIELTDLQEGIDVGRIVNDIPDVLERALRNIRGTVLRPREGADAAQELELNTRELKAWMEDPNNQQLLAMLGPRLADDLNEVDAAYELLNTARNRAAFEIKEAQDRLSFKRLVTKRDETPSATIRGALNSERPEYELNQIWRGITNVSATDVSKEVRDGARESLKSGLIDWAIARSSNRDGHLNPKRMYDSLFKPIKPGSSITVSEWMQSKNLIGKDDFETIEKYLAEITALETLLTKEGIDALLKEGGSPLRDLALRIVGAKMGTTASGLIGGSEASLIAASAGSAALRALFVSKSGVNNMKAFKELLSDPEFLAKMLKTPRDKRQAKNMFQLARDWMFSKGFVLGRRAYALEEAEEEEFDLPPRTIQELAEKTGRFEMLPVSLPKEKTPTPQPEPTVPDPAVPDPAVSGPRIRGPLSVKNNNPGNLRLAGQPGAVQGDGGFAAFASPSQGLRALTRQVVLDTQTRDMTLESFLNKYAPPSENKTNRYIKFVERQTGLNAKQKVPESKIPELVRAIVRMEGGQAAVDYFYGQPQRAETELPQRAPLAQAGPPPMPPAPPSPAPISPQSLARTAQVLGPQDEIGKLASELMMRQRPS